MSNYSSSGDLAERYIKVTPAGCYHAIESRDLTLLRQLLHRILGESVTPALSSHDGLERDDLTKLQGAGFIELVQQPLSLPQGNLLSLLPQILPELSERSKALLIESQQGLYLDFAGVSQSQAERLAVLAAELRATADKTSSLLSGELSIASHATAIVDPAGNSELGFWPLHIGDNVFSLIIAGIPRFNSEPFCTLVWALVERYGQHHQHT